MSESYGEKSLEKGPEFNYQNCEAEKIISPKPFLLGHMMCPWLHTHPVASSLPKSSYLPQGGGLQNLFLVKKISTPESLKSFWEWNKLFLVEIDFSNSFASQSIFKLKPWKY